MVTYLLTSKSLFTTTGSRYIILFFIGMGLGTKSGGFFGLLKAIQTELLLTSLVLLTRESYFVIVNHVRIQVLNQSVFVVSRRLYDL